MQVPPLKSASGHRAEDWDIDKPLMTGHLKVFQTDDKLKIVLYRYKDPASTSTVDNLIIFAECPISVKPKEDITPFVDAVIDSSRYYVLRLVPMMSSLAPFRVYTTFILLGAHVRKPVG